jgi:hypothetical protein
MSMLLLILEKKSPCQSANEDSEDPDEEEFEVQLMEACCDCIVDIAKATGPLLEPHFAPLLRSLLTYQVTGTYCYILTSSQQKKDSSAYRSLAVGVLAEVSNAMGYAVAPHLEVLINSAFAGMSDSDSEVRSNAAFFIGVLLQNGNITAYPYFGKALQLLAPMFTDAKGTLPNLLDNACGAVARMILAAPNVVPIPEVIL